MTIVYDLSKPKKAQLFEVPKPDERHTLTAMGKTTSTKLGDWKMRATSDLEIEFISESGDELRIPMSSVRIFAQAVQHARFAIEQWHKIISGQRTPRIWTEDGATMCEYLGEKGQLRRVNGRNHRRCWVCRQESLVRFEAVRVPWSTPNLPMLCPSCVEVYSTDLTHEYGKLRAVKRGANR